jgi:acyl-CoA reductase-like NAD-dependent aldehyde dehydrogenase
MTAGDPMSDSTTIGATINRVHAEKVLGFVERAKKEGATVSCGGERIMLDGELAGGYYLSPCILTDCR